LGLHNDGFGGIKNLTPQQKKRGGGHKCFSHECHRPSFLQTLLVAHQCCLRGVFLSLFQATHVEQDFSVVTGGEKCNEAVRMPSMIRIGMTFAIGSAVQGIMEKGESAEFD
jgi:hypothetical protein